MFNVGLQEQIMINCRKFRSILLTMYSFVVVIAALFVLPIFSGSLDDKLHYYETLHHHAIRHRVTKRDLSMQPESRFLEFRSHNKHFKLVLHKDTSVFANDFAAFVVDEKNRKHSVELMPEFYQGYDVSEPDSSRAHAYWEEDQLIAASVHSANETYVIESSHRHLPPSKNHTMIVYRASDMKFSPDPSGQTFCASVSNSSQSYNVPFDTPIRSKRHSELPCKRDNKTLCSLLLVADHRVHKALGYRKEQSTMYHLINNFYLINKLYEDQKFGDCGTGFGFVIRQIQVLTSASESGFNDNSYDWKADKFLLNFHETYSSSLSRFCLAHLFTAIPFEGGVVGLAQRGSVCQHKNRINVGWTSFCKLKKEHMLLTQEAMLTTAHELGHNFGSDHDTDDCSPSASAGGKYLMHQFQVSGRDPNNRLFSSCSRTSIGMLLKQVLPGCFVEKLNVKCGNFQVDDGEDCDEGPELNKFGKCCSSTTCKFVENAVCSDVNHDCCDNCQIANSSKVCFKGPNMTCFEDTHCDGANINCDRSENSAKPKKDGESCARGGFCHGAQCVSVCEYNKMKSCLCDSVEESCKWCCMYPNNECKPYERTNSSQDVGVSTMPEGSPCIWGFCQSDGLCVKQEAKTILNWFESVMKEAGAFEKAMRDNIVGTVIILSLMAWIPLSCLFSYMDKKKENSLCNPTETETESFKKMIHHDSHNGDDSIDGMKGKRNMRIMRSQRIRRSEHSLRYHHLNSPF